MAKKPKIGIGYRNGMLTVAEASDERKGNYTVWKCRCDCGRETVVGQTPLQSGKTKSCGCLVYAGKERNVEKNDQRGLIDGTSVSMIEARMNKPPIASNTSGYNGVYKKKTNDKRSAQITFKGKTYYLGSFFDLETAVKARKRGEEVFDDFLDWYYAQYPERKSGTDRT